MSFISSKMISNVLSVIIGASSFVYTCYILCRLTYFLSNHDDNENLHIASDENTTDSTLWSLLIDMLLITIFVFQHSIMANEFTKNTFCRLRVEHLSRSIYNACSSASLHFLINKWQQTPAATVWKFDTSNQAIWMIFSSLHVFAWSIIYSGCIMMDIAELCGLKQIWYRVSKRNSPLDTKSKELRRYMKHLRHPSFTGFLVILWVYPIMSADRVLLSTILTIYMALLWTIDSEDYNYHVRYFRQKQIELS
ncbi:PREDICTED: nurim homolog [Wasmannia auropunctata]|uniref:nurim homolog n=1 Tax=Wasmannia auropunctata TaxID=64793 RepID=UPI0005ED745B|nr:PREDICTED: nurim homolog [Wasmannia auropunctata]